MADSGLARWIHQGRGLARRDLPWTAVLLAVNAIVLVNAVLHDPAIGYDAADHLRYIEALSQGRLPLRSDTLEFFSPPLPYLIPAALRATGAVSLWQAGKAAQLVNVLCSIGLTLCLVHLCERVRPADARLKTLALLTLGMLPVYYKTFAFVRGEPLLAFLALLAVCQVVDRALGEGPSAKGAAWIGVTLGLAALSRQWGFFLLPACGLALAAIAALRRLPPLRAVAIVAAPLLVAAAVSGWFYLHLRGTFGSWRAFNRTPVRGFALSNLSREFYLGLGLPELFTDPVRRSFHNQFLPTYYSEMWGDYWTTFTVYGVDRRDGRYLSGGALLEALSAEPRPDWLDTNRASVAPFLGRANAVSLAPTAVLVAGALFGGWRLASLARSLRDHGRAALETTAGPLTDEARGSAIQAFLFLVVVGSLAGYCWFLVMYPRADTIKASYMLQIDPLLAVLASEWILRVRERSLGLHRALLAALVLPALHNAPLYFTRYPQSW